MYHGLISDSDWNEGGSNDGTPRSRSDFFISTLVLIKTSAFIGTEKRNGKVGLFYYCFYGLASEYLWSRFIGNLLLNGSTITLKYVVVLSLPIAL